MNMLIFLEIIGKIKILGGNFGIGALVLGCIELLDGETIDSEEDGTKLVATIISGITEGEEYNKHMKYMLDRLKDNS